MPNSNNLVGVSVLVIGAGGFIGRNLITALLVAGANVTGFGRNDPHNTKKDIRWIAGSFSDQDLLKTAIKGAEVVYHLINESTLESQNKFLQEGLINISDTFKMLSICRLEGVSKVVFVSSGGAIYGVKNSFPISEEDIPNPICDYGINKLIIEKYLLLYNYIYGIDYIIIRISNAFGPYQSTHRAQGIIGTLLSNWIKNETTEIWGNGEVIRDYIYISDVIDGLIKSATYSGSSKIFNLGSGMGRSINEVIADLESNIGMGAIRKKYTNSSRPFDVPNNILDISRIQKALNWRPKVDWQESLRLTINWHLERKEKTN